MTEPFEERLRDGLARLMATAPAPKPLPDDLQAAAPARRRVPAWVLAPVAAVVAATAIGLPLYLLRGGQEGSDLGHVTPSLSEALDTTDALVVIEGITPLDLVTQESGAQYQRFEVSVQEVLYEVETPTQAVDPEYPRDLPPLAPGALRVYEPLGSEASRRGAPAVSRVAEVSLAPGDRAVLLLGYWAPEVYPDWPAAWSVVGLARLGADGTLTFLDDPQGLMGTGLAAAASGAAPGLSPVEVLAAWLAEKDATRGGAPEGPLQAAYDASLTPWGPTSTTTTSSLPPASTSTSGPGEAGRWVTVTPATGRPGEPLVICGRVLGASQILVVLSHVRSGDSWPYEIDGVTAPDETGHWCWTGTIPRELESNNPPTMFQRLPAPAGEYEVRVESFGNIVGYASLTVTGVDEVEPASQSPEDARRDGVVAAVAELPASLRVDPLVEVPATEGAWVLSRLTAEVMEATGASGCRFGDTDGTTPEEVICTSEYGEILLLDEAGAIVRAYPMPAAPPSWILTAWDAVYAGRVGDGALGNSTLVRIDRRTLEAEVVLVPTGEHPGTGVWPYSWRIAGLDQVPAFEELVLTDDGAGTPAESWIGPITVDLAGIDRFLAGFRFGVEQVDLPAALTATPEAVPAWEVRLPWGDEPGQVSYSGDFGPCCLDITPDGTLVLLGFSRLQAYDGSEWRVVYEGGPLADGIAALDSGLIAVPTADSPSDQRVLLLDLEGNIVQEGEAWREANNGWWGGEDLWATLGSPPFTSWARITRNGSLIPIGEQKKVDAYSDSVLTFQRTYDRRGDYDTAFNLTTVTVTMAGETRQWLVYGGEVAGGAQFTRLDDGILGLWYAGSDYLVVTMRPDQPVGIMRIPLSQWVQTATFGFFRVHEGRLYLLQTYPDGARIEVYELP
jgi:hypothetical protein